MFFFKKKGIKKIINKKENLTELEINEKES